MSKTQRTYNKETLPREFKFRVNKNTYTKMIQILFTLVVNFITPHGVFIGQIMKKNTVNYIKKTMC